MKGGRGQMNEENNVKKEIESSLASQLTHTSGIQQLSCNNNKHNANKHQSGQNQWCYSD